MKRKKIVSFSLIVLFLEIMLLFGAKYSYAQNGVTPTLYCLAANCPNTTPTLSPTIPGGVSPTPPLSTSVQPTTSTTNVAPSSFQPCPATSSQIPAQRRGNSDRGMDDSGGRSGFLSEFFKFFLLLLDIILKMVGAGGTSLPCTQPSSPQPSTTVTDVPVSTIPVTPVPSVATTSATTTSTPPTSASTTQRIAVVYSDATTGPADGDDTGALVALLQSDTKQNFKVITAGPNGSMTVQQALAMPGVVLYGQPGASGDDVSAYNNQKGDTTAIQNFVKNGGHYLGICMGGFLAEPDHFNIFPGQVNDYDDAHGLSQNSAMVQVSWRGKTRQMYFQDGGFMVPNAGVAGVTVLAKFATGEDAAVVAPYGKGKVGVIGPHPEAPQGWYSDANLTDSDGLDPDLGRDFIDTLMQ